MRVYSTNAPCPRCGATATVSIVEAIDVVADTEGHRVEFICDHGCPAPDDATLLRLWAAARGSSQPAVR